MTSVTAEENGLVLDAINIALVNLDKKIRQYEADGFFEGNKSIMDQILAGIKKAIEEGASLTANIDIYLESLDITFLDLHKQIDDLQKEKERLQSAVPGLKELEDKFKLERLSWTAQNEILRLALMQTNKEIKELKEANAELLLHKVASTNRIEQLIAGKDKSDKENEQWREETKLVKAELEELKQRLKDKKIIVEDLKGELKEERQNEAKALLGDFAFQFKELLGKYLGIDGRANVKEATNYLNYENSKIEIQKKLRDIGFDNKHKVSCLKAGLEHLIDNRFELAHPGISGREKITLEQLKTLAQDHNQYQYFSPIFEFWNKMMKDGEVFGNRASWKTY